jgi:hypothetical protein
MMAFSPGYGIFDGRGGHILLQSIYLAELSEGQY